MDEQMLLSDAWEKEAHRWMEWARTPGHDSYWKFHKEQFLPLLPKPGLLTVDIGCGEGRLPRDLKALGHKVAGFDASKTLIAFAKEADPEGRYEVANANLLPLADGCADLAIAFMSLQDVDDLEKAVAEMARVLIEGGRACIAIVHPINSAGNFVDESKNSAFIIERSYLQEYRYSDTFGRDGLEMTFHSTHRTLERYSQELEKSGFLIEVIRECALPEHAVDGDRARRWQRIPMFIHIRAVKFQLPIK
jgi:ubiquinone/menaquinone biosynthesis C-methylase UbiE